MYSQSYEDLSAIHAWGATLDDLQRYIQGEFSKETITTVRAWYKARGLIRANEEDFAEKQRNKK